MSATHPDRGMTDLLQTELRRIAHLGDDLERYRAATSLLAELDAVSEALTAQRSFSVARLYDRGGGTFAAIAALVGLTRGRVGQMVAAGRGRYTSAQLLQVATPGE